MPNFSPLSALAAAGICASLAMLGSEIEAQRPSVIRYEYSIVLPDPPSDDDADSPPSQDGHHQDRQHWHERDPRDGDGEEGHPIGKQDPDSVIPI